MKERYLRSVTILKSFRLGLWILALLGVAFGGCADSAARVFVSEVPCDGVQIATWNIANFGASKSDSEIQFISSIVKSYDVLAIEEVSTGQAGAQAVARLDDELDRTGSLWDYVISDPTSGDGSERYAVLWNTAAVKNVGSPVLFTALAASVNREPFLVRLSEGKDTFLLAVFHAVPKSKNPSSENVQLCVIDSLFERDHLLILGDFNASARTAGFTWLKRRAMTGALINQKTSLKQNPDEHGNTLANEYDNIFYETDEIVCSASGFNNFSTAFATLTEARTISDHIPVWGCFRVSKK